MGKTSNASKDKYNAKAYDDIRLRVPKGQKEKIQTFAESNGETVNGFINRLIAEAMGADKTDEAIAIYRSRYIPIGKFENTPYPGIHALLETLQNRGHKLYVATSKPEAMSKEILEHFDLAKYFTMICGASLDLSRHSKEAVISYLLEESGEADNMIMVGDTIFDIVGAKAHGIPAVGVSWGYGVVEDMVNAGAIAIANTMEELLEILDQ